MNQITNLSSEYVPCDLCGSTDHELVYSKIDSHTGLEFHLVACACGMAFVNPMPTDESIPRLYPEDYLQAKEYQTLMYRRMLSFLPPPQGKRLLDIGCGRGDFIEYASKNGWEVQGVDKLRWETPYLVPVTVGDFLTMDVAPGSFDAVTAWAILEHVRTPSAFFRKIRTLLTDNGRFVFTVPNVDAPGMRISCSEDVPRHLWLFSPETVRRYLDDAGMEPVLISHNAKIYTSYPFGLVRYAVARLRAKDLTCAQYENKSVALLRNRQITRNLGLWVREVLTRIGPWDLVLDAVDLAVGLGVSYWARLSRNYGVLTVVARKRDERTPVHS
ncbi:MAG: class I SAM-dependent methyltransferase [Thermodesulfobacteriota bacterium]